MSQCPHSSTRALDVAPRSGQYRYRCPDCGIAGDWSKSPRIAYASCSDALLKDINPEKETYMSSDYRRGVEDGTMFLCEEDQTYRGSLINDRLEQRRKSLLAKKETRWVIVIKAQIHDEEYTYQGRLFESKEAAKKHLERSCGDSALGVFPIEIEAPVD